MSKHDSNRPQESTRIKERGDFRCIHAPFLISFSCYCASGVCSHRPVRCRALYESNPCGSSDPKRGSVCRRHGSGADLEVWTAELPTVQQPNGGTTWNNSRWIDAEEYWRYLFYIYIERSGPDASRIVYKMERRLTCCCMSWPFSRPENGEHGPSQSPFQEDRFVFSPCWYAWVLFSYIATFKKIKQITIMICRSL